MKILAISPAPWIQSGYGRQAGYWFPRFASAGHDVRLYAYRGLIGSEITWPDKATDTASPILVYPTGRLSQFGLEQVPYYHKSFKPDVVISLCDLFLFDSIKGVIAHNQYPWHHWMPIDCEPLGAPDYNIMTITGINPIAMSSFGHNQLADAGWPDAPVCYHSTDTTRFVPPTEIEKHDARTRLGIDDDMFVVGMNAGNESSADRKAFCQQLSAFSAFHQRHPNSALYLFTILYRHPVGLDLDSMIARYGLQDAVIYPDPGELNGGGVAEEQMIYQFYWTLDLFTSCSKGEGFGIPAVEAQACGVPVVASYNSTFPETTARGEYGARLVPTQREWSTLSSSDWRVPIIDHIEDAYEMFHLEWKNTLLEPYRHAARQHSLQFHPDAIWHSQWEPALQKIQEEI